MEYCRNIPSILQCYVGIRFTRREKYNNVFQSNIVIVGQVKEIWRFSPNIDIASPNRLHIV